MKLIAELNDALISRETAANYLGVKPATLACWASTKRYPIPMIKVGRSVKYRKSDLDAFINHNTIKEAA